MERSTIDLSVEQQLSELSYLVIKKSWDEITISDFFLIKEIQDDPNSINLLTKIVKILSVCSGKEASYFDKFPKSEIKQLYETLTFLNEEIKGELKDTYLLGETKYKLIKMIDEQSYGQFIDLNKHSEDGNNLDSIHLILSTVLIPVEKLPTGKEIPEEYLKTPLEKIANDIYDFMPVSDGLTIMLFFCLLEIAFVIHTRTYLEKETQNRLKLVLKILNPTTKEAIQIQEIMNTIENGIGLSL